MRFRSIPSKSLFYRLSSSSTSQSPSRVITFLVTNSNSSAFSTTANSASAISRRIQHEEESRSVKVSVWWDLESSDLPQGANVFKLAQSITSAIRNVGIKGPITITAFGDFLRLPRSNQDALTATGISLTHVPQGGKNSSSSAAASSHTSLIMDLMCWVSQNPPPAHLFLISSDKEFASVLHRLRMSNYNILLASKSSSVSGVLCSAASIMWDWESLIKGEFVSGKCFNQPPDGPYNSWYGHYRIPLLDPFATTEQSSSSLKTEELSSNSVNVRPVPKEVVEKIRFILSLYPKGVFISVLHFELFKSDVVVDKDFYGYKKFSRFLQSMPDILQVSNPSDGSFMVHAVTEKTTDSSPGLSTVNGSSPELNSNLVELAAETRRDDSLGKNQQNVTEIEKHLELESQERSQEPEDVKAKDKPMETNQAALIVGSDSSMEDGFFEKLKRLWYGSTGMESKHLPEDKSVSGTGNKEKVDKDLNSSSQGANSTSQISPSFAGESSEEVKAETDEVDNNDKNVSPGFFSQLLKSFKFWGRDTGLSGNQKLVDADSQEHEIFAKESFWSDVESFINSPRGFTIISHSRTRKLLAKNMQKEGPSCLKLLDESNMLHLVTLLISHKKWIQESLSSSLPFSINKGSTTTSSNRHASNGLSSIFADCSKSQRQKQDGDLHSGVSFKSKAIADCQKLIKRIREENPEGYRLIRFRKDFLEEYGYYLAVDKLGYESLQSLIQAMPGVRLASGYILPIKEDDSDLSFEELGPVSEATTNQPKLPVYEPSLSEDEDSGSERDNPRKKKKNGGEDKESSLLQILDSYYTSKNGEVTEKPGERKLVSNIRKQKSSKTYSFVKDAEVQ